MEKIPDLFKHSSAVLAKTVFSQEQTKKAGNTYRPVGTGRALLSLHTYIQCSFFLLVLEHKNVHLSCPINGCQTEKSPNPIIHTFMSKCCCRCQTA